MPSLVAAIEHELNTDFAMLGATQAIGELERPMSWNLATSIPGVVSLRCGFKYARASIRLERWDGPPPEDRELWEDRDEVPFEALDDLGPLRPFGFDPPDGPGLDVRGLGRSRVRVLARGRHQYWRGEPVPGQWAPEEFLLQMWPDPYRRDAMAGEPRRLAAPRSFYVERSAWREIFQTWKHTGWNRYLANAIPVFKRIHDALHAARGPRRLDDLPVVPSYAAGPTPPFQPITSDMPLRAIVSDESQWDRAPLWRAQLQEALGMSIETFGDLLSALIRLGLIARLDDGSNRFTAIPQRMPVSDVFDLPDDEVRKMTWQSDLDLYRTIPDDLLHLIVWAPDRTLHATPMQMAMRLALSVYDVLGSLRLLATTSSHGRLRAHNDLEHATGHEKLELQLVGHPPRRMRWPT